MQIWYPMFCKCAIVQDKKTLEGIEIRRKCPAHQHIIDPKILNETLLEESRRAMNVLRQVELNMTGIYDLIQQQDGTISKQFKPGKDIQFFYDDPKSRDLTIKLVGFDALQIAGVKTFAANFETLAGKIKVV